jgi:hypothetical protein
MERYSLDEARQIALTLAQRGGATYYVVSTDADYCVLSAAHLGQIADKHHNVVFAAEPPAAVG